ncbi:3D domain-containing protein [Joostella sp. CR20]|uniref:3D domain-containing protein n=1 Tax=Joostella sp. CR20 TaxID=2804312 RepID=UPI00313CE60B
MKLYFFILISIAFNTLLNAQEGNINDDDFIWTPLQVKASAYNSLENQTVGNPSIGAWGDSLQPGMKAIAISRDLLKLGITQNTPIKIEGFDGIYFVKDKMNARFHKKIDIYMGIELQKARKFGVKHLKIWYGLPNTSP